MEKQHPPLLDRLDCFCPPMLGPSPSQTCKFGLYWWRPQIMFHVLLIFQLTSPVVEFWKLLDDTWSVHACGTYRQFLVNNLIRQKILQQNSRTWEEPWEPSRPSSQA